MKLKQYVMSQDLTLKGQDSQADLILLFIRTMLPITVWYRCHNCCVLIAGLRMEFMPLCWLLYTFYNFFKYIFFIRVLWTGKIPPFSTFSPTRSIVLVVGYVRKMSLNLSDQVVIASLCLLFCIVRFDVKTVWLEPGLTVSFSFLVQNKELTYKCKRGVRRLISENFFSSFNSYSC